ncbi:(2Fe-2S)-binding protein [Egicoccus halophilus]|uniref:Putative xanthine dehydrogenase subunit E n=1 Tax=Egicoccus halophilus TaxID=1670830 RepID=A0A8J3AA50_9ACTN|nr:2Fe-2S iron-sulfur cluster-binding protein [Egicoccus halophilus]GGI02371.1 putative xanthine dehydrogenase subunit E [Egicoccus halophilus]
MVTFDLNGQDTSYSGPPDRSLLTVLREEFDLTAAKPSCEIGVCGACSVLVDGELVSSCCLLIGQLDGRAVQTLEGMLEEPQMCDLRRAFAEHGGFQCGFCTPGHLVAAYWRLRNGRETEDVDNLCRCTGYYGIRRAIEAVASCR